MVENLQTVYVGQFTWGESLLNSNEGVQWLILVALETRLIA